MLAHLERKRQYIQECLTKVKQVYLLQHWGSLVKLWDPIAERSNSETVVGAIRVRILPGDVFWKKEKGKKLIGVRTKLKPYCLLLHMVINTHG